ncbi:RagB/SusD family nutrient uptake outer membrane protein [soil metagenome]
MKIQHKLKIWLVLSIAVVLVVSCKDELEKSPLDQFDSASFWTSEENALLALTGVYKGNIAVNGTSVNPTDWWSYAGLIFLEFATDNAYDRRGNNSAFHKLSGGTLTPNINILGNYWAQSYTRIARCNDFLVNIGKVPMDETKKKRMAAEVRFIRAAQYFYMSQFWGSVPLVTKLLTPEEANTLTKAPKAEVVAFVLSEFTDAAADLPRYKDIPAAERGRASKQAALAFLGRLQLAEGKYAEAANSYKTIIDFGDNIIDPDYPGLFVTANENSHEHIFIFQHLDNLSGHGLPQHAWPAVAGGWHIICPLGSIVEAHQFSDGTPFSYTDPRYDHRDLKKNRDPRLGYNILFNGDSFKGRYITHPDSARAPDQLGAGKQTTQTGYGIRKFMDEGYTGGQTLYGGNLPVIRYAEVLLSYLEAKLEAGHPIDQGLLNATINRVRGRSSVNMPPVTQTNPAQLREILRNERRVELAFEGIRYWDLLRWKIADKVLKADFYGTPFPQAVKKRHKNANTIDPHGRWYVTTRNFRMSDYQWPIPQGETNINPGLK